MPLSYGSRLPRAANLDDLGLPVITGKVTIPSSGATIARSSATGTPTFRIFDVASTGSLTMNSVTIKNGLANSATQGGGGIFNHGTLTVTGSTFPGNTGGTNGGGAIINFGPTTVTQATISGNSSPYGANILNYTGFTLKIGMSVVVNGQGGPNCGGGQPVTDTGYNMDTGSTCGFSNNSKSNTSPQLGPLASNGGPTQTMAVPSGSPAVDAIPASTPGCTGTTDQGAQDARATFSSATDWYAVAAVFHQA